MERNPIEKLMRKIANAVNAVVKFDELGAGRLAFGMNIAYEKFVHGEFELYLNIYLVKYQIVIGKFYK